MPEYDESEGFDSVVPKGVKMAELDQLAGKENAAAKGKKPTNATRKLQELTSNNAEHPMAPSDDVDGERAAIQEQIATTIQEAARAGKRVLDLTNIPAFLLRPQEKGPRVKCFVKRERATLKMFPTYRMYLQNGERFLLSATRWKVSSYPCYSISTDPEDPFKDNQVFGTLSATYNGLEWSLADNGDSWTAPKGRELAKELGAFYFAPSGRDVVDRFMGTARAQRKMKVILPPVSENLERASWTPRAANQEILNRYKTASDEFEHMALSTKKSEWNPDTRQYELNFNGRAAMASVKNFQLVDKEDPENIVLQMGKIKDDVYTLDYSFPFCPLQAFAIALASLDTKLAAN